MHPNELYLCLRPIKVAFFVGDIKSVTTPVESRVA